jgi:restriction endonuclease S subunit
MRADEEKRMAERKKQEEERRVREVEEKKQRDIEEKRRRLEEAEKKRQAMMQALKVRRISNSNKFDNSEFTQCYRGYYTVQFIYFYRNRNNRRGPTLPSRRRIHQ